VGSVRVSVQRGIIILKMFGKKLFTKLFKIGHFNGGTKSLL
jgi:hypothetical protein